MSDDNQIFAGIDLSNIKEMQEIKRRQAEGEEIDPRTIEAMASIEMAGNLIDSVMSGKMVDLAYLKLFAARMKGRMDSLNKEMTPKKKVPKNTRKYRKMMREKHKK